MKMGVHLQQARRGATLWYSGKRFERRDLSSDHVSNIPHFVAGVLDSSYSIWSKLES
jgi:hypothetical protein